MRYQLAANAEQIRGDWEAEVKATFKRCWYPGLVGGSLNIQGSRNFQVIRFSDGYVEVGTATHKGRTWNLKVIDNGGTARTICRQERYALHVTEEIDYKKLLTS